MAYSLEIEGLVSRIHELVEALRGMTTNRVHDALCQNFEEWEPEHAAFARAKELVERSK
jgi:hypothetical protein